MKRQLNILMLCLCTLCGAQAQTSNDERDFSSGSTYNSDLRELVDGKGHFPGGLDDDGRGPDEDIYIVRTETEFLAALGNNRTVVVAADVHLNLSRVLENEQMFRNQPGRRWCVNATDIISKEPLIVSESETDGQQLALLFLCA